VPPRRARWDYDARVSSKKRSGGPFAAISRRRWLKLGLGAIGGLIGLGAGGLAWVRGCAPSVSGLRVLDDHEHQTLRHLVVVLFGARIYGQDVAAMDLPRAFDGFLADSPEDDVSDLRSAITLLEIGPVIDRKHASPFSRLSDEERTAFFRGWMEGDDVLRRQVALAFRKFFSLVMFDRPEVWPGIGYPGPSLEHP